MENWSTERIAILKAKTENYSDEERKNISYSYVVNLLSKMSDEVLTSDEVLYSKINYLIAELPEKTVGKSIQYSTKYLMEIDDLQSYVEEKYDLVEKEKFRNRYLNLGLILGPALGLPFGAAFGNIGLGLALGIPIGMLIGIYYGNYLDKKAKKERRVL
jgi:hypothetical protein